jgi:hypothetical protein
MLAQLLLCCAALSGAHAAAAEVSATGAAPINVASNTITKDRFYSRIEIMHGDNEWGSVLDAGTGIASLSWALRLPTTSVTAITAMNKTIARELYPTHGGRRAPPLREGRDRLVLGDWTNESLLQGEAFDVVIADHLVGSMDRFSPYYQGAIFKRLRRHVNKRLYVVGLAPVVNQVQGTAGCCATPACCLLRAACTEEESGMIPYLCCPLQLPTSAGGKLVVQAERLKDACKLIAGVRCGACGMRHCSDNCALITLPLLVFMQGSVLAAHVCPLHRPANAPAA